MHRAIVKIWTLIIISIIVSGCAGIVRESLYAPSLDKNSSNDNLAYHRYRLDLLDAQIIVFPVVVSEKLHSLYGPALAFPTPLSDDEVIEQPLIIDIWVQVKRGTATLNMSESTVKLDNKILYPKDVLSKSIRHYPGKRSEFTYEKIKKELVLTARHSPYRFILSYGIDRGDLEPFSLELRDFNLNGESISINPIPFNHASHYISK